jgi:hypothetical protein
MMDVPSGGDEGSLDPTKSMLRPRGEAPSGGDAASDSQRVRPEGATLVIK